MNSTIIMYTQRNISHLPLQDTVMLKTVADRLNASKTVVEASAAAALHVDTTSQEKPIQSL